MHVILDGGLIGWTVDDEKPFFQRLIWKSAGNLCLYDRDPIFTKLKLTFNYHIQLFYMKKKNRM